MTTIVFNDKSIEAKKMLEFLKTQSYVKVVEEDVIISKKQKKRNSIDESLNDIKKGRVSTYTSVDDMISSILKKNNQSVRKRFDSL